MYGGTQRIHGRCSSYAGQLMISRLGLLFIVFFGLSSCENYELVNDDELGQAFIINSSPTFMGYYYHGSDSEYNYFVSKWTTGDKYFKINIDKLTIKNELMFNKGESELRIDLIGIGQEEFAKNEFCQLFIVQE